MTGMNEAAKRAAELIGATPADIPGLWNAPGYPELTTGQLLQIAAKRGLTIAPIGEQP